MQIFSANYKYMGPYKREISRLFNEIKFMAEIIKQAHISLLFVLGLFNLFTLNPYKRK